MSVPITRKLYTVLLWATAGSPVKTERASRHGDKVKAPSFTHPYVSTQKCACVHSQQTAVFIIFSFCKWGLFPPLRPSL